MAVINSLAFDDDTGAILADEEYWFLRRRKSYFADSLHDLVPPEAADDWNLFAVYGGVGTPSFHGEVVGKVRAEIARQYREWKDKGGARPLTTVDGVGNLVVEMTQKTVRRRVDEKLRFFYGFSTDDFLRGSWEVDGKKVPIQQEKVKNRARGIIEYTEKSPLVKSIYDNVAVLLGWDAVHGMGHFHLKAENCVLSMVSGRFEAVGKGKYASAMVLTHYLQNKTLSERREGLDRTEGTIELVRATLRAGDSFHEAGGHLNMVLLDARETGHGRRVREISDDRAKLVSESVRALDAGLVERGVVRTMVDGLVYGRSAPDKMEDLLFKSARSVKNLGLLLRGYKFQDWLDDGGFAVSAGKKRARGKEGGRK
jgi:hypothetical protein